MTKHGFCRDSTPLYLRKQFSKCTSTLVKTPNQLNNIVFSVSMMEKQLHIMNPQSAPGPDVISTPRVLKHLASVLVARLENIFTKSMKTGQLPPAWKSALVEPMFKGGR